MRKTPRALAFWHANRRDRPIPRDEATRLPAATILGPITLEDHAFAVLRARARPPVLRTRRRIKRRATCRIAGVFSAPDLLLRGHRPRPSWLVPARRGQRRDRLRSGARAREKPRPFFITNLRPLPSPWACACDLLPRHALLRSARARDRRQRDQQGETRPDPEEARDARGARSGSAHHAEACHGDP